MVLNTLVRSAGGRYVFPLDIEERLDDRERRILARMDRLRGLHEASSSISEPDGDGVAASPARAGEADDE